MTQMQPYQDLCVCVINFLNDSRDRIVQFPRDHVAALAGQDFKAAVRIDSGENRVLDAVELNGFFQFPVWGVAGGDGWIRMTKIRMTSISMVRVGFFDLCKSGFPTS